MGLYLLFISTLNTIFFYMYHTHINLFHFNKNKSPDTLVIYNELVCTSKNIINRTIINKVHQTQYLNKFYLRATVIWQLESRFIIISIDYVLNKAINQIKPWQHKYVFKCVCVRGAVLCNWNTSKMKNILCV